MSSCTSFICTIENIAALQLIELRSDRRFSRQSIFFCIAISLIPYALVNGFIVFFDYVFFNYSLTKFFYRNKLKLLLATRDCSNRLTPLEKGSKFHTLGQPFRTIFTIL